MKTKTQERTQREFTSVKAVVLLERFPEVLAQLRLTDAKKIPPDIPFWGMLLTSVNKHASHNRVECLITIDVPTIMGDGRRDFYQLLRTLSPTHGSPEILTLRTYVEPANLVKVIEWREHRSKTTFDPFAAFKKRSPEHTPKNKWIWIRDFKETDSGKIEVTFEVNVRPLGDWFTQVSDLIHWLGWEEKQKNN